MKTTFFCVILILGCSSLFAQNYHAIHGTSVAGSLNVANNPASIVHMPGAWDIVPLSVQVKNSTNAFTVLRYSYLSSVSNSQYRINGGNYSRYISNNFNVRLLNARFALSRTQAIAFGLNIRGYTQAKTGTYNFRDTVKRLRSFFLLNEANRILHGQAKHNSWIELFGTYSRTVWDTELDRLNAGVTMKVTGGVSGGIAGMENAGVQPAVVNNKLSYVVGSGNGMYAYSAGYDQVRKDNQPAQNVRNFLGAARKSISFDLGIDYIVKPEVITGFDDEDAYYDYTWKFGFSLLDLGRNRYEYGSQSRSVDQFKSGISDSVLQRKTTVTRTLRAFNDSLSSIVNNLQPLTGTFFINNPSRLVINVDRSISEHIFINGELTINLSVFGAHNTPYVNEMNLLSVTPRWESRRFGVYLPAQYNTQKQFWLGGAFRAGPLLMGVHNLSSLFAKNKTQNGGGYLAIIIRPGSRQVRQSRDKRSDCPVL